MTTYLLIGLGSALGGVGRFWIGSCVTKQFGDMLPWGTIVVNVTGCFAIGLIAVLAGPAGIFRYPKLAEFLMIGVCGGYTTFSAFSLQTLLLLQQGNWALAGLNVSISVIACLLAVWLPFLAAEVLGISIAASE